MNSYSQDPLDGAQLQPFKGRRFKRQRQLRGFCLCVVESVFFNIRGQFIF